MELKVGDKIEALIDYPTAGSVKKGEIGVCIDSERCKFKFPSQKYYSASNYNDTTKYKLLPREMKKEDFVKGKWYKNLSSYKFIGKFSHFDATNNFCIKPNTHYVNEHKVLELTSHGRLCSDWQNAEECDFSKIEYLFPESIKQSTQFETGKWYKRIENYVMGPSYLLYVKHSRLVDKDWGIDQEYTEKIYVDGTYEKGTNTCSKDDFISIDVSEIQQYLPDGHVDKVQKSSFIPDKWFIVPGTKENLKLLNKYFNGLLDGYVISFKDNSYTNEARYYSQRKDVPSEYKEISMDFFKEHIFKEVDHFQEAVKENPKIKEKPTFEKGKWYNSDDWYIKHDYFSNNGNAIASEYINPGGKYSKDSIGTSKSAMYLYKLSDMNEVCKYLPEDHPDRIEYEKHKMPKDFTNYLKNYVESDDKFGQIKLGKPIYGTGGLDRYISAVDPYLLDEMVHFSKNSHIKSKYKPNINAEVTNLVIKKKSPIRLKSVESEIKLKTN